MKPQTVRRVVRFLTPSLVFVGVVMLLPVGAELSYRTWFALHGVVLNSEAKRELMDLRQGVLSYKPLFLGFVYGAYRILFYHPAWRSGYRRWLASTPYDGTQPPPLGPVNLNLRDLFSLGVLATMMMLSDRWQVPAMLSALMSCFLWPYLLLLAFNLRVTGQTAAAYVAAFGLGSMTLLTPFPIASLTVAALTYAVAHGGLKRSLRGFPWELSDPDSSRPSLGEYGVLLTSISEAVQGFSSHAARVFGSDKGPLRKTGWPAMRLGPRNVDTHVSPTDGIGMSFLAGWYVFAANGIVGNLDWDSIASLFLLFLAVYAAGARVVWFIDGHLPPISWFGRIATGRLIIPSYDRVFVAPLVAVWIARSLPRFLEGLGLPVGVVVPIAVTAALLPLLCTGPKLRDWRLTAPCRISPVSLMNSSQSRQVGLRKI